MIFTVIGQKLIYSPELTKWDHIFYRVFWDLSLRLSEAPPKKFILCSGFDKICKKNTNKRLFFFTLKLHNFDFIASQIYNNSPWLLESKVEND